MLVRKIPVFDYGELSLLPIKNADFLKGMFYIAIPPLTDLSKEVTLLSVPGALTMRVICRSFDDEGEDSASLKREECFYFNDTNEWILEAICHMTTKDGAGAGKYTVRLPLSAPFDKNALGFVFDGVWLRFVSGGEVLNENSGLDCFASPTGEIAVSGNHTLLASPITHISVSYREEKTDAPMDFFYPYGWNTSIGDVMNFAHDGTYHAVYLLDRRHHGSRGGCGAHYMAHLTTKDFVNWYEQTPITPIDEPWKTFGTGTMLYHGGKYYMTFGYHSERYAGACQKTEPIYDEKAGFYQPLSVRALLEKGELPAGASYAESDDGIDFTMSDVLFHAGRNPSAYVDENGEINLFVGYGGDGCFRAESMEKPFYKGEMTFPYARKALMKNTTECPAFFTFNGYKYLIVGFTGYYRTKEKGGSEYIDAHALGECIYDGLGVPMVATTQNGRRIMAGWLPGVNGWGGAMMHRELVFEENGTLGMKWLPELVPTPEGEDLLTAYDGVSPIALPERKSWLLSLSLPALHGKASFIFEDGEKKCVLWLDGKRERAGFASDEGSEIPTDAEQLSAFGDTIDIYPQANLKDIARHARNYTLSNVKGMDTPFSLRVVARYSRRMRATVFDVEIAQRRTLISVRADFFPTSLSLCLGSEEKGTLATSLALITDGE